MTDTVAAPYPLLLDALHERSASGRLVASPTAFVLASPAALPGAPDGPLRQLGLAVADADPESAFGAGPSFERFTHGLLDLHRELLRRTVGTAISHLDSRTSAGSTLLSKQLVEGQLADIAMVLSEEEAMASQRRDADPQARWRSFQRLVAAGRALAFLFGASGFLADGPVADLHLAEVTGNVYLHPDVEGFDD